MAHYVAPPKKGAKILLFDIETAPSLGVYFDLWREGNIVWTERGWYVLCWAAKWLGQNQVMSAALPDYPLYKRDSENDLHVMEALWKLLNEADIVITHNGDKFDIKKSNARFLLHEMRPPEPYHTVDTLKVARNKFGFESNKLNDIATLLGVGKKVETGGMSLWRNCLKGDLKAWRLMVKYCKGDVELLERVYKLLRPWMHNHPNLNLWQDSDMNCPNCGSGHMVKQGYKRTRVSIKQQFQCRDCGSWASCPIKGEAVIR